MKIRIQTFIGSSLVVLVILLSVSLPVLSKTAADHYVHLPIAVRGREHWANVYSGDEVEEGRTIIAARDGGFILLVKKGPQVLAGSQDNLVVAKLDSAGVILWQKEFEAATSPFFAYGIETSDGSIVVCATGGNRTDAWVMKLDGAGNILWQKNYGGYAGVEHAHSIVETADGGYLFAGSTYSFGLGYIDLWLVKLDQSGNIVWEKTYYGSSYLGSAAAVQTVNGGGFIIAGYTASTTASYLWVLRVDSTGSVVWQKAFGNGGHESGLSLVQAGNGDFIVVGYTEPSTAGSRDALVVRLAGDGSVVWQKAYGGSGLETAYSIHNAGNDQYLVAGTTTSYGAGDQDAWVLKLNGQGNILWQKTYGGVNRDYANSIAETLEGKYVIAGMYNSNGSNSGEALVLKLDPDGSIGSCAIVGQSTATAANTSFIGYSPNVQIQSSAADTADTTASRTSGSLVMSQMCSTP